VGTIQPRMLREIPRFAAMTVVAPGDRFNTLAIFVTPFFSLAIDFNNFKSSFDHERLTTFFFLANFDFLFFGSRACNRSSSFGNSKTDHF
jgi:hypothetical protein